MVLSFFFLNKITAQNLQNERQLTVSVVSDTLVNDTLTIAQSSIQIIDLQTNTKIDSNIFVVKNNLILLKKTTTKNDFKNLKISYRVLPINLGKPFFRLDSSKIDAYAPPSFVEYADYANPSVSNQIFDKSLDYSGNYTQGFSLGNNLNLVVNQNFNLNLS